MKRKALGFGWELFKCIFHHVISHPWFTADNIEKGVFRFTAVPALSVRSDGKWRKILDLYANSSFYDGSRIHSVEQCEAPISLNISP